jgi:phosphatidylglycerophosphatase A
MRALSKVLATFFGLGFFPAAPGTLASAAAVLLYKSVLHRLAWPSYLLLVTALFAVGAAAAAAYATELGRPDPGRVVVDEVCGQLLALTLFPTGWPALAVSFVLFRFFDIIKPWPIKKLEKLPGGWGIMADDVGAGLAAAILGRLVLFLV